MRLRVFLFFGALPLFSCYVFLPHTYIEDVFSEGNGLLVSENIKLQFFWELGVVVRTHEHLYLKNGYGNKELLVGAVNGSNAKSGVFPKNLCGDIGVSIVPSKNGFFDAKCFWEIRDLHHNGKMDYLIKNAFDRFVYTKIVNNEYHIYYSGEKPLTNPDSIAVHRKLTLEEADAILFEYEKDCGCSAKVFFSYELVFSLNEPVYTISLKRNVNEFKGYKPLVLDSSDLPLERFENAAMPFD